MQLLELDCIKKQIDTESCAGFFAEIAPASKVKGNKKATSLEGRFWNSGRGERIRTSDSYVPNVVLYQAELHPENCLSNRS